MISLEAISKVLTYMNVEMPLSELKFQYKYGKYYFYDSCDCLLFVIDRFGFNSLTENVTVIIDRYPKKEEVSLEYLCKVI